jgi:mRNA interferase MazF
LALVKRGEVWLVALDPTLGSEIRKTRPALIVSPDEMNAHLRTVIVAPLTSASFSAPFRVAVNFDGVSGLILIDQIRAVSRQRLRRRMGAVEPQILSEVLAVLGATFSP